MDITDDTPSDMKIQIKHYIFIFFFSNCIGNLFTRQKFKYKISNRFCWMAVLNILSVILDMIRVWVYISCRIHVKVLKLLSNNDNKLKNWKIPIQLMYWGPADSNNEWPKLSFTTVRTIPLRCI